MYIHVLWYIKDVYGADINRHWPESLPAISRELGVHL